MFLVEFPDYVTKTYLYGDEGFFVDVISVYDSMYEVYLGHKDYGIKDLICGVQQKDYSFDELLELINDIIGDYIDTFIEEHFD